MADCDTQVMRDDGIYAHWWYLTCFCATKNAVDNHYSNNPDKNEWEYDLLRYYSTLNADPCLIYYDDLKMICARCKYGAIRIIS